MNPARTIRGILARMRLTTLIAVLMTATVVASDTYPPPRFADPGRVAKLQSAMPEIDRIFRAYATRTKIPGMIRALKNEVGECTDAGPVMPENWIGSPAVRMGAPTGAPAGVSCGR
jgi:hypothetical protein